MGDFCPACVTSLDEIMCDLGGYTRQAEAADDDDPGRAMLRKIS